MKKVISIFLLAVVLYSLCCPAFAEGAENAVNWLKPPEYDYQDVEYFERNYYVFTDSSGKKGLIDNEGKIIIAAIYDRFERCSCGNIKVNATDSIVLNEYSYTVEKRVTESLHGAAYKSFYGYNQADDKLYLLMDADQLLGTVYTGTDAVVFERVNLTFDLQLGGYSKSDYRLGSYGIYTSSGSTVGEYSDAVGFENGVCAVYNGSKWAYANADGQLLTDFLYDASKESTHTADTSQVYLASDGLIPVNKDGLWGYIDAFGQERVGCVFEKTTPSSDGKAWVKSAGKWGIADLSSIPVIAQTAVITGIDSGSAIVGQTVQLSYSAYPSQGQLFWHSSSDDIAQVDNNGFVTCISDGQTVIRITNELGQEIAAYTLTVQAPQTATRRFNPTGLIVAVLSLVFVLAAAVCGLFVYNYVRVRKKDRS